MLCFLQRSFSGDTGLTLSGTDTINLSDVLSLHINNICYVVVIEGLTYQWDTFGHFWITSLKCWPPFGRCFLVSGTFWSTQGLHGIEGGYVTLVRF